MWSTAGELRACASAPGSGSRRTTRGCAARMIGSRVSISAWAGEPSYSTIPAYRFDLSHDGLPAAPGVAHRVQPNGVRPWVFRYRHDGKQHRVTLRKPGAAKADDARAAALPYSPARRAVAAFVLAAQRAFHDAVVELVHLSNAEVRPIEFTSRKLQTWRDKLIGFLADIRRGRFTPKVSSRTCPSCRASSSADRYPMES